MNWLDLKLPIEDRLSISLMAEGIDRMEPNARRELFIKLATANKLQEKAIQQLTVQIFHQEASDHAS
jgi:hypothetical protein